MKLQLLLDEHVPALIGSEDYEARYIHEVAGLSRGADDQDILRYANENGFVVVTNDDDFLGEIPNNSCVMYYPSQSVDGWELSKIIETLCEHINSSDDIYGNEIKLTREWLSD